MEGSFPGGLTAAEPPRGRGAQAAPAGPRAAPEPAPWCRPSQAWRAEGSPWPPGSELCPLPLGRLRHIHAAGLDRTALSLLGWRATPVCCWHVSGGGTRFWGQLWDPASAGTPGVRDNPCHRQGREDLPASCHDWRHVEHSEGRWLEPQFVSTMVTRIPTLSRVGVSLI